MSETIVPKVKLLIAYDILPGRREEYYEFIVSEFVPAAQAMGLYMHEAWHTAYGDYPARLAELVAEDVATLYEALDSEEWNRLEARLKSYTSGYSVKIVRFKRGFQF